MKINVRRTVLTALAMGVAVLVLPTDASAQRKFTFGYDQPKTTAYGIAARYLRRQAQGIERRQDERSISFPARNSARNR